MSPPARQGTLHADRCDWMRCDRASGPHRDAGYTIIEITLVVLILGLLLAICIPAFLGTKQHAQNRSAQSSLRDSLTNAKAIYADQDSYSAVTPAALHAVESAIGFTGGTSTGPKLVSVTADAHEVVAVARSDSGVCFALGDAAGPAGTVFALLPPATCRASAAPAVPAALPADAVATVGGGWATSW